MILPGDLRLRVVKGEVAVSDQGEGVQLTHRRGGRAAGIGCLLQPGDHIQEQAAILKQLNAVVVHHVEQDRGGQAGAQTGDVPFFQQDAPGGEEFCYLAAQGGQGGELSRALKLLVLLLEPGAEKGGKTAAGLGQGLGQPGQFFRRVLAQQGVDLETARGQAAQHRFVDQPGQGGQRRAGNLQCGRAGEITAKDGQAGKDRTLFFA